MNVKKSFVLFIIILTLICSSVIYLLKSISPIIKVVCESKAKAIAVQITEQTVNEFLKNVKYETLMNLKYNKDGKIIAINANVIEMNRISTEIAYRIQNKLMNMEKVNVQIPVGKLLGWSIFSGYGPDIHIKLVPMGNISTDFKTEFTSQGINQTKHRIYINIISTVTIVAPFMSENVDCKSTITVAETVIVGDIPETYYNIQGMEKVAETGVTDLLQ